MYLDFFFFNRQRILSFLFSTMHAFVWRPHKTSYASNASHGQATRDSLSFHGHKILSEFLSYICIIKPFVCNSNLNASRSECLSTSKRVDFPNT
uniref:Putative secreted protein n=1 Tax=Ixodes ricinus TaxID=34613 RepID=A0A6B0UEP9_IXORI